MDDHRLHSLIKRLTALNNAVIAFSGGVDSTFLVRVAILSGIRFLAVTGESDTVPRLDIQNAMAMAGEYNFAHRIIRTNELEDERFLENTRERCFFCKNGLFTQLRTIAEEEEYTYVLDGSNADDLNDYRPGLKANRKHGVISPLIDTGMAKKDVRELSKALGLETWDKQSSPCLSSRVIYGSRITSGTLLMIAESENFLRKLGFTTVRVRTSGSTASIEVGEHEVERFTSSELCRTVREKLQAIGYREIRIDLEGYRSGKLNTERYGQNNSMTILIDDRIR